MVFVVAAIAALPLIYLCVAGSSAGLDGHRERRLAKLDPPGKVAYLRSLGVDLDEFEEVAILRQPDLALELFKARRTKRVYD